MNPDFEKLRVAAADLIKQRYHYGRHTVAAAVQGATGKIYTSVNLDCYLRRAAACAESGAIAAAISAGETAITHILALRHNTDVPANPCLVSPCGICRELIADYGENATVYVPGENDQAIAHKISELLPSRYAKQGKSS